MRFNVKEQKFLAYQDKVQYTRFAYLVELIDKLSRKQKKKLKAEMKTEPRLNYYIQK